MNKFLLRAAAVALGSAALSFNSTAFADEKKDVYEKLCTIDEGNQKLKKAPTGRQIQRAEYVSALLSTYATNLDYRMMLIGNDDIQASAYQNLPDSKLVDYIKKNGSLLRTISDSIWMADEDYQKSVCPPKDRRDKLCNAIDKMRLASLRHFTTDKAPDKLGFAEVYLSFGKSRNNLKTKSQISTIRQNIQNTDAPMPSDSLFLYCGRKPLNLGGDGLGIPEPIKIRKTASDIALNRKSPGHNDELKKGTQASLTLSFDRTDQKDFVDPNNNTQLNRYDDSVEAQISVGWRHQFNMAEEYSQGEKIGDWFGVLVPYIGLEYDDNFNPAEETDNLSFGLNFAIFRKKSDKALLNEQSLIPQFNIAWITDIEERESSAWTGEARINIPFFYNSLIENDFIDSTLFVEPVVDFVNVIEIGDKTKQAVGETIRYGYDIHGSISLPFIELSGWTPGMSATYQKREGFRSDTQDPDLFSASLSLAESENGRLSFALTYEEGYNLISGERINSHKLSLLLKN